MTNLLLVFDEQDEDIGPFNQGCMEDYIDFLKDKSFNIIYINSKQLNAVNIQFIANQLKHFVFVAYSHGGSSNLSCSGDYVSNGVNIDLFVNSFFYTVSCHTANELGSELIKNGCLCYFGYKSPFNSWYGYKDFSVCANWGFFQFIDGVTSNETFSSMITKYNEHIDEIKQKDFLVASLLRENRDGLIMLGENISINDLT